MDFKVAGTEDGITALQMDMKIPGLALELLLKQLSKQARPARLHILEKMIEAIEKPRELSPLPCFCSRSRSIRPNWIIDREARRLRHHEETGAKIDIEDDGIDDFRCG